ncbi:MAG TPA: TolC family protein, partial [Polyangiales bacterium]|nr:TolC family protein [Polyangiales bacterium]
MACAHGGSAAHPDEHVEPVAPHLREPKQHEHAAVAMPDPQVAQEVTLDAILAYADARAPQLAVARSTRARAEAAHVGADRLLPENPEVHFAVGPRITNEGTGVDFAAGVSQRFEIAGERGLRLSAADRLAELSDAQIERLRWSVHCDVHAAFHEAIVAREQAVLADSVQAFQEEVLRIVERQIAAGETAPLTLRLAQAEVAQARQAALAAHQRHYAARLSLAAQAGWPPELPPTPRGELDAPRDPPELEALLALARAKLPELAEREAAVREAQARAVAE